MNLPKISWNTPDYLIPGINYAIENLIDKGFIKKYKEHRNNSLRRGIEFKFTFDEWYKWWMIDNRWENRGIKRGQFVMARKNDIGPYSPENVYCATCEQNTKDISNQTRANMILKSSKKKKKQII